MIVNEKLLLANINEYLVKDDTQGVGFSAKNGVINRIVIGDPSIVIGNLYKVPVRLNVSFDNKDDLLSFIENIEKKVLADQKYRILYKIDEVSYDIINYTTKQNVDILLAAYYYK